ncbi:hypothetical protein KX729_09150 [Rhizobium sp. XQZ8]|uniref:hypothetical protein n=1 Tax=Rhizobium populisoli TaxID=2859785 RepID=UPI001CA5131B|nr:hypothetical protein [Rhizobium populisoli]MBW6421605.1 hypothetical protein [Rhizobium populisoli]
MADIDFLELLKKALEGNGGIAPIPQARPDMQEQPPMPLAAAMPQEPKQEQGGFFSGLLPQDPTKREALGNGLLNAGAAMMVAGGPSVGRPTNFLQVLGSGVGAGAQAYQNYRKDASEIGINDAKIAAGKAKLSQEQAAKQFAGGLGSPAMGEAVDADTGYSVGQLKKLFQFYISQSELSAAGGILDKINRLDDERAKDGMIRGADGSYRNAPGLVASQAQLEQGKAAGRVSGEESQRKTDDIREYEYGNDNPGFVQRQDELSDSKRQANRLQKTGAYIDPKTNTRFNGYFDNATGNTIYKDATNATVSDPAVINRMVEDTPGRTKANMSDPVVKDERGAEAALAQAAGRTQQSIGTVDRMLKLSDDINKNSWFGTGGYNGTAKMLDAWLPGDNFSGSTRQELDNLMQDQIKGEIESLRGLGAMSDRDLAAIQDRVLNGNLNPAALKDIADRMRKISQYNANKYEAWKKSGQTDEFRSWNFNFDKDNYEGFMGAKEEKKSDEKPKAEGKPAATITMGKTVVGEDGKQYRFKGGNPNDKKNWEPVM